MRVTQDTYATAVHWSLSNLCHDAVTSHERPWWCCHGVKTTPWWHADGQHNGAL